MKLHGLHAHIGSQIFETKVYHDEIEILVREIKRLDDKFALKLDEINIGGGLGVKYTEKMFLRLHLKLLMLFLSL